MYGLYGTGNQKSFSKQMMDIAGVTAPHDVFRRFHHGELGCWESPQPSPWMVPSWELTYPLQKQYWEDDFPNFPFGGDMLEKMEGFFVWYFDKNADIFTPSFTINDGLSDLESCWVDELVTTMFTTWIRACWRWKLFDHFFIEKLFTNLVLPQIFAFFFRHMECFLPTRFFFWIAPDSQTVKENSPM